MRRMTMIPLFAAGLALGAATNAAAASHHVGPNTAPNMPAYQYRGPAVGNVTTTAPGRSAIGTGPAIRHERNRTRLGKSHSGKLGPRRSNVVPHSPRVVGSGVQSGLNRR